MADDANPRIFEGANNPPLSPFEAVSIHIEDLLIEARNWADGQPASNQGQADEISRLIDDLRKAGDAADDLRIEEKTPWDEKIEEIQVRYNVYIGGLKSKVKNPGKVVVAIDALKAALKPYLDKLAAEKRAAEEAAQAEAARAAAAAAEAMRSAASDDLEAREAAEDLVETARLAEAAASRAAHDKAQAHGGSRALGLKKFYRPELVAPGEALRHYAVERNAELKDFLLGLAVADVREGKRQIPGFKVVEDTRL
jgi:hypothetical protein